MSEPTHPSDDPRSEIIRRARRDPAFRAALLADPRAAIRDGLGIEIPAEVEVSVHEESPSRLVLVLPAAPGELSEQQLSGVAGGAFGYASTRMQRLFLGGNVYSMA